MDDATYRRGGDHVQVLSFDLSCLLFYRRHRLVPLAWYSVGMVMAQFR